MACGQPARPATEPFAALPALDCMRTRMVSEQNSARHGQPRCSRAARAAYDWRRAHVRARSICASACNLSPRLAAVSLCSSCFLTGCPQACQQLSRRGALHIRSPPALAPGWCVVQAWVLELRHARHTYTDTHLRAACRCSSNLRLARGLMSARCRSSGCCCEGSISAHAARHLPSRGGALATRSA